MGCGGLLKDVGGEGFKKLILILWGSNLRNIDKIRDDIIDWKWWFSDLSAIPAPLFAISIAHSYCQLLTVVPLWSFISKYITKLTHLK